MPFVRYLDAYLYFSVRCVAGRLNIPRIPPREDDPEKPEVNELPAAWPSPPEIPSQYADEALAATTSDARRRKHDELGQRARGAQVSRRLRRLCQRTERVRN